VCVCVCMPMILHAMKRFIDFELSSLSGWRHIWYQRPCCALHISSQPESATACQSHNTLSVYSFVQTSIISVKSTRECHLHYILWHPSSRMQNQVCVEPSTSAVNQINKGKTSYICQQQNSSRNVAVPQTLSVMSCIERQMPRGKEQNRMHSTVSVETELICVANCCQWWSLWMRAAPNDHAISEARWVYGYNPSWLARGKHE